MAREHKDDSAPRARIAPGRPKIEHAGAGPSPQLRIRVTPMTHDRLARAAGLEERTVSEVARDAFDLYLSRKHPTL